MTTHIVIRRTLAADYLCKICLMGIGCYSPEYINNKFHIKDYTSSEVCSDVPSNCIIINYINIIKHWLCTSFK